MRTVFVTGDSGYIGRNLIRGLLSAGFSVRALARSDASTGVVKSLGRYTGESKPVFDERQTQQWY